MEKKIIKSATIEGASLYNMVYDSADVTIELYQWYNGFGVTIETPEHWYDNEFSTLEKAEEYFESGVKYYKSQAEFFNLHK